MIGLSSRGDLIGQLASIRQMEGVSVGCHIVSGSTCQGSYLNQQGCMPLRLEIFITHPLGVVHFVYLSTETNLIPESQQYQFLKNDLESVDREKTPFVVVQGHRPMYTTSTGHKDGPLQERMREHLEPLFVKNKVTLVLWGHVLRYERFCPMTNFTCGSLEKNGDDDWQAFPVNIVIGMAGQDHQPTWRPREDHPNDPVSPQPAQSMYRGGEFGYTRLVATKKKLKLYYVGNHDGRVHDMVEIRAPGHHLSHTRGDNVAESSFSWLLRKIDSPTL